MKEPSVCEIEVHKPRPRRNLSSVELKRIASHLWDKSEDARQAAMALEEKAAIIDAEYDVR